MPIGSPMFRPRSGSDRLVAGAWGVMPSGPLPSNVRAGRASGRASSSSRGPLGLPGKEAVDYVHSLTQTTLLLVGLGAFLVFHRGRGREAVRKLQGRVT